MTRVAILGAGMLGESLLSGLLASGRPAADMVISERHEARATQLADTYGVTVASSADAARGAEVVFLAVKPQDMGALLGEIAGAVTASTLVVSMAAGVTLATLEAGLPDGTPLVRVMSNTPVRIRMAMSALSPGRHAGDEHLAQAQELLGAVGATVVVPESQQDAVTALSGSGPAYFFFLVEAMIDAGILLGLPRTVAADLITQTALGAATMLRESGEHPVALREAVTSPGGTTIAAIRELEDHGVRAALLAALEAARDRSRELAAGSG
ncbi:MAG TPA: pyrroline-5-carboxylate reductase [Mycobacteriales bacterium]